MSKQREDYVVFINQVLSNISSSFCSSLLPDTGLWRKHRPEHPLVLYWDSYVTEWIIISVDFGLLFFHWHFPTRTARNCLEALKDFKNKNFSWRLFSVRSLIQVQNLSLWLNDYHQLEGKRSLLLKTSISETPTTASSSLCSWLSTA